MGTNKLNEFISEVKSGMAKPMYFAVDLHLPKELQKITDIQNNINKVMLFCDQAQLPGISFSTNQVRSYGEFKEVPYEKLYEPITLSFYVDADMIVKKLFDEWVSLIQNPKSRDFNYPENYITQKITIKTLDVNGVDRYTVTLKDVYPKSVSPIQLDYAAREVMKIQVTFTYKYAEMARASAASAESGYLSSYTQTMPNYNYGYDATTEIPSNYFSDFTGYQAQYVDFISGVKSLTTVESIGVQTGFGGIFI